jgi:hypothetical protein
MASAHSSSRVYKSEIQDADIMFVSQKIFAIIFLLLLLKKFFLVGGFTTAEAKA